MRRFAEHLTDALVVKEGRRPDRIDVNGDPRAQDQCFGMIDLKPIAADKLYRKGAERDTTLESSKNPIEVLKGHGIILRYFRTPCHLI